MQTVFGWIFFRIRLGILGRIWKVWGSNFTQVSRNFLIFQQQTMGLKIDLRQLSYRMQELVVQNEELQQNVRLNIDRRLQIECGSQYSEKFTKRSRMVVKVLVLKFRFTLICCCRWSRFRLVLVSCRRFRLFDWLWIRMVFFRIVWRIYRQEQSMILKGAKNIVIISVITQARLVGSFVQFGTY